MFVPAEVSRGPVKLAAIDAGNPIETPADTAADPLSIDNTLDAQPGTGTGSGGVSVNGITAPVVNATIFGPAGAEQIASAMDTVGVASGDGGASFQIAVYQPGDSVAWWQGASGSWLLFGNIAEPGVNGLSGFLNWTSGSSPILNANVSGSDTASLGLPAEYDEVSALAGVPGSDTAFVGTASGNGVDAGTIGSLRRVTLGPGPSISSVTKIGDDVISTPVDSLAYCPAAGSASSIQDVLLVMAGNASGVTLFRVSGATGADPTVATIMQFAAEPAGQGPLRPKVRADCASGTVLAASSGSLSRGLQKSTDGGQSFGALPITVAGQVLSMQVQAIAMPAGNPASIMVGGNVVNGAGFGEIVSSSDGGQTWTVENDPATGQNFAGPEISDMAAPPAGPYAMPTASGTGVIASGSWTGVIASGSESAEHGFSDPFASLALPASADLVAGAGEFAGNLAAPMTSPPSNTALPSISGTTVQGQTLSTSNGTWSNSPASFTYQWRDCDGSGANCANITGATTSTHVLSAADVDHTLRVVVTATNEAGSAAATSRQTATVTASPGGPPVTTSTAPTDTRLPSISGAAVLGQKLSASNGTWSNSPASFAYQWRDCDHAGTGCKNIKGATGSTRVLSAADVGQTLRVVVTATNAGGSTPATSHPTAVVTAAPAVTGVRLTASTFAAKAGTTLRLTLSAPATITVLVMKNTPGRRLKGTCRADAKRGKRCTVTVQKARLSFHGAIGRNSFKFRTPSLPPGRYSAVLSARSPGSRISKPITFTFTCKSTAAHRPR